MNPTIMIDKQRGTEYFRRGETKRAIHLARWGGLGTHRYQIGFSGDVLGLTWDNLAYQPYFSATGSNVGYGFWSHDIEGPGNDPEMYVRWVQWAAMSGVFRSHDRGMSAGGCETLAENGCSRVRPWEVPTKYFDPIRKALQLRDVMLPYIYNTLRQVCSCFFVKGVGVVVFCRVLWRVLMCCVVCRRTTPACPSCAPCTMTTRKMTWRTSVRTKTASFCCADVGWFGSHRLFTSTADRFGNFAQYMFGDDIMVAPIVSAADNTSMTKKTIFTPVGMWYEASSGMLYDVKTPGSTLTKSFSLEEIPIFIKAGSVIPYRIDPDVIGSASRQYMFLGFAVYPGAASGSGRCAACVCVCV